MSDETITNDYLDRLQAICDAATEGPWYAVYTDDKDSMNAVYVGTVDRGNEHDNEPGMDGSRCGEIVAATLIQQMPRVDHDTELWDENAAFIAESRTALPLLIAEVRRLRGAILSFGNGNEFDWNVLGRIDELETENARLRQDNRGWEIRHDMLLTKIGGEEFDSEIAAEKLAREM